MRKHAILSILLLASTLLLSGPALAINISPTEAKERVHKLLREEYGSGGQGFYMELRGDAGSADQDDRDLVAMKVQGDQRAALLIYEYNQQGKPEQIWKRSIEPENFDRSKLNRIRQTSHIYVEVHRPQGELDLSDYTVLDVSSKPPTKLIELKDVIDTRGFIMGMGEVPRVLLVQSAPGPVNAEEPPYKYNLYSLHYTGREYFLFEPVNRIRETQDHPEAEINNRAVELYQQGELLRARDGFERAIQEAELNPSGAINVIQSNLDVVEYHLDLIQNENYTRAGMISSVGEYSDARGEFLKGNYSNTYTTLSQVEQSSGLSRGGLYLMVTSLVELGNWNLLDRYESRIWNLPQDHLEHLLLRILPELEQNNFPRFRNYLLRAERKLSDGSPLILLWKAKLLSERADARGDALRMLENRWWSLDLSDPAGARCAALYYELLSLKNRPEDAKQVFQRIRKTDKFDLGPLRRVMSMHLQNYPVSFPKTEEEQPQQTSKEEMLERFREQMEQGE